MFTLKQSKCSSIRLIANVRGYKSILGRPSQPKKDHQHKKQEKEASKRRSWNILPEVVKFQRSQLLRNEECVSSLVTRSRGLYSQTVAPIFKLQEGRTDCMDTNELKEAVSAITEPRNQLSEYLKDIELECCRRIPTLNLSDLLYFADAFILMERESERYIRRAFHHLGQKWDVFEPNSGELLQILFLVGVYRSAPAELMALIEKSLAKMVGKYNTSELSLVCHAFFASNKAISDITILDTMSRKILAERKRFHHYELANYFKCFNHANYDSVEFYEEFGDVIIRQLNSFTSLSSLGHVAHTYSSLRIQHKELMDALMSRAGDIIIYNQENGWPIRTKDLVRLIGYASNLQCHIPKSMTDFLVERFENDSMLREQFPEMFVEGLVNLAHAGIYSEKCLNMALSPVMLRAKKGRLLEQAYQMHLLDCVAGDLCQEYKGNRLDERYFDSSNENLTQNLGLELYTRNGLSSAWGTLRRLLGPDKVRLACHLEHSKVADLELRLAADGTPISFNKEDDDMLELAETIDSKLDLAVSSPTGKSIIQMVLEEMSVLDKRHLFWTRDLPDLYKESKVKSKHGEKRVLLRMCGWNQCFLNAPTLTSSTRLEVEMLNHMGYDVMVINPKQASALNVLSYPDLVDYVEKLLGRMDVKYQPNKKRASAQAS